MDDEPITIQAPKESEHTNHFTKYSIYSIAVVLTIVFSILLFALTRHPKQEDTETPETIATPTIENTYESTNDTEHTVKSFAVKDNAVYQINDADEETLLLSNDDLNAVAPNDTLTVKQIAWDFTDNRLFVFVNVGPTNNYALYATLDGKDLRGIDFVSEQSTSPSGGYFAYTKSASDTDFLNLFIYNFATKEYEQVTDLEDTYCSMSYSNISWESESTLTAHYDGYGCTTDENTIIGSGDKTISLNSYFTSN